MSVQLIALAVRQSLAEHIEDMGLTLPPELDRERMAPPPPPEEEIRQALAEYIQRIDAEVTQ